MATKKLTDLTINALKAPKTGRLEIWDTLVPGFGIRITENDARTWFIMYRVGKGDRRKQRRLKIGNAKIMRLPEARMAARDKLLFAATGRDPAGAGQRLPDDQAVHTGRTVSETVAEYLEKHIAEKTGNRHAKETRRIFEKNVLPVIGERLLSDVTRRDVDDIIERILKRGAKIAANRTLTRLKTFFRWVVNKEYIAASPAAKILEPASETERDRTLDENEICLVLKGCDRLGWPFGHLYKFLLLTLQRLNEAANMEWQEVDLEKRLWVIPRHRTKNKKAHSVHLSDEAVAILRDAHKITGSARYVFTRKGKTPVSGFSTAKAKLDRFIEEYRLLEKGVPVSPFIIHDLRRTGATQMAGLKVPPHVVDKILNHTSGTIRGVAAIYNRNQYFEERCEAMDLWGQRITKIASTAMRTGVEQVAA
jgi:integrase